VIFLLLELYIFFEILAVGLFLFAFYSKNEIIWGITLVLFGIMAMSSFDIEYPVYSYNATTIAYDTVITHNYYPYLIWINALFFFISLVLTIFDIFDKYGKKLADDIDKGVKLR